MPILVVRHICLNPRSNNIYIKETRSMVKASESFEGEGEKRCKNLLYFVLGSQSEDGASSFG